jgi:hypothetical protein
MKGYPTWFKASVVHWIVSFLFITGCFLVPTTLNSHTHWEMELRLTNDARIWMTLLHVLAGFVTCALIGALWTVHMRYWWRKRKGRLSGGTLLSIFAFLGLTGVGILYAGRESLVSLNALAHTVVGLALVVPYIWHTVIRKRLGY